MAKENKSLQWTRPMDVVPYPNVWIEFVANESKTSDKLVKYRIQDLPEDRFDDAIKHMKDNYLLDEPLSVACGKIKHIFDFNIFYILCSSEIKTDGMNNKDYVDDYLRMWRRALQQKTSLVCFREGSDEIVGLNVLVVNTKNDAFIDEVVQQVIFVFSFVESSAAHEKIHISEQKQGLQ